MTFAKSGNGAVVLRDGDGIVFHVTSRSIEIRLERGGEAILTVGLPHESGDDPNPAIASIVRLMEAATGMVVTLECTRRSDDLVYRFEGA